MDDYSAAWSPNGKKIAFSSFDGNDFEIYKMNTDGTGQVRLTDNSTSDGVPDWSPNGSKLVFVRHDGNYCVVDDEDTRSGCEQTKEFENP